MRVYIHLSILVYVEESVSYDPESTRRSVEGTRQNVARLTAI